MHVIFLKFFTHFPFQRILRKCTIKMHDILYDITITFESQFVKVSVKLKNFWLLHVHVYRRKGMTNAKK